MTPLWEYLSSGVASYGLAIATKSTLVLVVTLGTVSFARRARASVRHLLLSASFGVLLVLSVGAVVGATAQRQLGPPRPDLHTVFSRASVDEPPVPLRPSLQAATTRRLDLAIASRRDLLTGIWLAGTLACLLPMVVGLWQVHRLRYSARPWIAGQLLVDARLRDAGLRQSVQVLREERLATPATWGFRAHRIYFPADVNRWSREEVAHATVHEVEHIRRHDCLITTVARGMCAFLWWQPLVWVALRRLCLEAERASDDAVLGCADATAYAEQLVELSGRATRPTWQMPMLSIVAQRHLVSRVTAILSATQARGRVSRPIAAAVSGVALVLALLLVQMRVTAQTQLPLTGLPEFEVASIKRSVDTSVWNNWSISGQRFSGMSTQVFQLIRMAWGDVQLPIEKPPTWIQAEPYDVIANAGASIANDAPLLRQMMRALLVDRFKLAAHLEPRETRIYRLRLARPDGRLGPGLQPPLMDCPLAASATLATGACGPGQQPDGLAFGNTNIANVAWILGMIVGARVEDESGLAGSYRVTLRFAPPALVSSTPDASGPPTAVAAPAILDAIEEQLGLKAVASKGSINVLVIDHIERPTPD